jgi:hypothetical protein
MRLHCLYNTGLSLQHGSVFTTLTRVQMSTGSSKFPTPPASPRAFSSPASTRVFRPLSALGGTWASVGQAGECAQSIRSASACAYCVLVHFQLVGLSFLLVGLSPSVWGPACCKRCFGQQRAGLFPETKLFVLHFLYCLYYTVQKSCPKMVLGVTLSSARKSDRQLLAV